MIEFIIGDVINIGEDYIVLQNNNIGYKVFSSDRSIYQLELGQKNVLLYTNLVVREDAILLYGFTNQEEIDMFNLLLLVSRIGPKVAIGILSSLSPNKIKRAILKKDSASLSKAPGVGKKTAERIILELKDRIDDKELLIDEDEVLEDKGINISEAVLALGSLGYTKYEVEKVIRNIDTEGLTVEDLIKEALKKLS